jgi:hypothetical protein
MYSSLEILPFLSVSIEEQQLLDLLLAERPFILWLRALPAFVCTIAVPDMAHIVTHSAMATITNPMFVRLNLFDSYHSLRSLRSRLSEEENNISRRGKLALLRAVLVSRGIVRMLVTNLRPE